MKEVYFKIPLSESDLLTTSVATDNASYIINLIWDKNEVTSDEKFICNIIRLVEAEVESERSVILTGCATYFPFDFTYNFTVETDSLPITKDNLFDITFGIVEK